MIIDCISDLHGYYPKLEGGDLLIVAGDLTAIDAPHQYATFVKWLNDQSYQKKIVICGNHDTAIEKGHSFIRGPHCDFEYLQDSGTEFEGLKIWGSPWTLAFPGMNPRCKAFTVTDEKKLSARWLLIPDDTDILVTHSPPKHGLDKTTYQEHVGSPSLRDWVFGHQPKLHVFGHIHECYGKVTSEQLKRLAKELLGDCLENRYITTIVNASHVNERYEPVNKPIRIIL